MEGEFIDPLDPHFYEYLAASLMCVTSIALAAGMTLGYLSLDVMKLKIKLELGTEDEKAAVEAILVLLKDRHLLLCTLLGNFFANLLYYKAYSEPLYYLRCSV